MVAALPSLVFCACIFQAIGLRIDKLPLGSEGGCKQLHNSLCRPSSQSKPLLITGSGGSGTHTVAFLFSLNRINLGHEHVEEHGSVSWPYAVDVTASNFSSEMCLESNESKYRWLLPTNHTFNHVVQLVRCPLDVVSALESHSLCSLKYVRDTLQLDFQDDELTTTKFFMSAWLKWNEHIERYANSRYRIDEFENEDTLKSIANLAGFDIGNHLVFPLSHVNHRPHDFLTWAQMRAADKDLAGQLEAKGREYGFPEPCFQDDRESVPLESQARSDTIVTAHEDSIFWVWNRSAIVGLEQRLEHCCV